MQESISTIKEKLSGTPTSQIFDFIEQYQADERAGVQKLVLQAEKQLLRQQKENERLKKMLEFEHKYKEYEYICGIDEVGRGPFAGPVVAAAVILPKDLKIQRLNDSKKLNAKVREELYVEIVESAISYGIGIVSPEVIDEINILQATYEAMRKAIHNLSIQPNLLLNDAVIIPGISNMKQVSIVQGDAKSMSIAAASVIAKVTRDKMMEQYALLYPEYDFDKNMGYGTETHRTALKEYGASPIHRRTFIQNWL